MLPGQDKGAVLLQRISMSELTAGDRKRVV
jgi:hypothetical protein